jgi:hypothetical protein
MKGPLASWGELEAGERKARCRALAGLVYVFGGPAAEALVLLLHAAEDDPAVLEHGDGMLAVLPSIPMRKALSVMVRLCRAGEAWP